MWLNNLVKVITRRKFHRQDLNLRPTDPEANMTNHSAIASTQT